MEFNEPVKSMVARGGHGATTYVLPGPADPTPDPPTRLAASCALECFFHFPLRVAKYRDRFRQADAMASEVDAGFVLHIPLEPHVSIVCIDRAYCIRLARAGGAAFAEAGGDFLADGSSGLSIGHISPEAAESGPIALVEEGDGALNAQPSASR